jgi:flagellar motor switch protein FliN
MATEHAMNMLTAAEQALASLALPPAAVELPRGVKAVQWRELDGSPAKTPAGRPKAACNDALDLRIEFGRTQIGRDEVEELRTGMVIALDNTAGDPVAVYAGGQVIARGDMIVIDGTFGVRVREVISPASGR